MTLKISNGAGFVAAKDVRVSNGSSFVQAKKIKTWNGSAWVLTWVPAVTGLTISFSKTGVAVGEAFTVTVSYAAGFPEGTTVQVTTNTGYNQTFSPAEGATSFTTPSVSHSGAGSPVWSAVATNLGGVSPTATKTQTVTAAAPPHFHKVVPSGSSASTIQAAMNEASNWFIANKNAAVNFDDEQTFACVELVANGTYNLGTSELKCRRGVRLVGGGSGSSRPLVVCGGTHFMNGDNNGGGGYNSPNYDWMVHNIEIDCGGVSGGLSISHVRRYQVSSCYFHHMGGKKHYVECNSSGGARADGTYNVRILNNEFTNSVNIATRRVEDECVQLDYSWPGAASNTANDGTVTNNVLIQGNNFHDAPRAIGSHHFEAGDGPDNWHANVLIQNNTFTNIDPEQYNGGDAPNGSLSEGAVRAYAWENVQILNNVFTNCFQPINLYIPGDAPTSYGNPVYYRIANNTIRNHYGTRRAISSSSGHASLRHDQILVEGNIFDGTWTCDDYAVGMEDTGTSKLANSNYGVVIRDNKFQPSNMSLAEEKGYNKYRADGDDNGGTAVMVQITNNLVSDGSVDNS